MAVSDTVSAAVGIGAYVRQHCANEQYVEVSKQYGIELIRTENSSFLFYVSRFALQHLLYLKLNDKMVSK